MSFGGSTFAGSTFAGGAPMASPSGALAESATTADSIASSAMGRSLAESAHTADAVTDHGHAVRALAESAATADSIVRAPSLHRHLNEQARTDDLIGVPTTVHGSLTATVIVAPLLRAFSVFPKPAPTPGPSGLHEYETIVCDKYGIAYGKIQSAVPTEIDWVLDDLGEALIDFYILEPGIASLLPISCFPGGREIQIWRDQVLIFWGWPTSATFDAKQVHLTCSGLLYPFSKLNFGPVSEEFLLNPDFELPASPGVVPGWDTDGLAGDVSFGVINAASNQPILLNQQALLMLNTNPTDRFIASNTAGPFPLTNIPPGFSASAWYFIIPGSGFAPGPNQNGLVIQTLVGGVLNEVQQAQITADSPQGVWTRLEVDIDFPFDPTAIVQVLLYAPMGYIIWDACSFTVPESTGTPPGGADATDLCITLVQYAQNVSFAKSNMAIAAGGPATGVNLIRTYQLADNSGILDALNEFPSIGILDFEVTWDETGHFRQFEVFPPAKGSIKWNAPLEIDLGTLTDLQGSVDGTQVATAPRVMGQGSTGSSEDIGFAIFPSLIGGRVFTDGITLSGVAEVFSATANFTEDDVGKGIYCMTPGVLPFGSFIIAIIDTEHAAISQDHQFIPPLPAALTIDPGTFGIGGIVIDNVGSALTDLPIGSLQSSAESTLQRQLQAAFVPTARFRADGPSGLFGLIETGDVVPVSMNYGWLTFDPVLMRITTLTLYPPTEELEVQLNPQPIAIATYAY